jgi:hypothetical protein
MDFLFYFLDSLSRKYLRPDLPFPSRYTGGWIHPCLLPIPQIVQWRASTDLLQASASSTPASSQRHLCQRPPHLPDPHFYSPYFILIPEHIFPQIKLRLQIRSMFGFWLQLPQGPGFLPRKKKAPDFFRFTQKLRGIGHHHVYGSHW